MLHNQLHHHLRRNLLGLLVVGVVGSAACGGESGSPGERGLAGSPGDEGDAAVVPIVQSEEVAPGEECEHGGTRIVSGLDTDRSGDLSADELAAGSSTLLCRAAASSCVDPVRITDISGVDQRFFEGVESAPLTVEWTSSTDVEFSFVAPDLAFKAGSSPGEFTIVPHAVGGPFEVAAVAWDGCTSHVTNFTIEAVDPAIGNLRGVTAYMALEPVSVAEQGSPTPLFEIPVLLFQGGPVPLDAGPHQLELSGGPPNGMGPNGPEFDMELGGDVTLATYLDVLNGAYQHKWLFLEDDLSPSEPDTRLRVLNLNSYAPSVSVEVIGQDTAAFETLAFAQLNAPQTIAPGGLGLGVDVDADGTSDSFFAFDRELFEAGAVANVFVINNGLSTLPPIDVGVLVLAQYLGEPGRTRLGSRAGMPPIDFDDQSRLPRFVRTSGYVDWAYDTSTSTSGGRSLKTGIYGGNASSRVEMTVIAPSDGTLSFDWKVSSEFDKDFLVYCLDPSEDCDRLNNTERISGEVDWTTISSPVSAGPHTLRWIFSKDNGGPLAGGNAWIDHVTFTPSAP